MSTRKILLVAGARPNFMKVAPLVWEIKRRQELEYVLVHTGQHYDHKLSALFFEQLGLPIPDINLEVGSGSHAVQTAKVMERFEPVVSNCKPDIVVVVGDVNSTVACALTAVKMGVPVAHVEAGLRSFDRSMPEEINRIVTDAISQWLFVSEESGIRNLQREGIPSERIHFVGNVMIDTLLAMKEYSDRTAVLSQLGVQPHEYAVLTLHRPSNVDDSSTLTGILEALVRIARELPIIFPAHPRTINKLKGLDSKYIRAFRVIEPLGYCEFIRLLSQARVVLTDSGGIQEETTVLGVPCLTLRETTERPVTIEEGTNHLVGLNPSAILSGYQRAISGVPNTRQSPTLWDGNAATRIFDVLCSSAI